MTSRREGGLPGCLQGVGNWLDSEVGDWVKCLGSRQGAILVKDEPSTPPPPFF